MRQERLVHQRVDIPRASVATDALGGHMVRHVVAIAQGQARLGLQPFAQPPQALRHDGAQVLGAERHIRDYAHPRQQRGFEVPLEGRTQFLNHVGRIGRSRAGRHLGNLLSAQIAGQQNNSVAKVDLPTLAVGHNAFVKDLIKRVQHFGMGLFSLVQQDNRIGFLAHRLGQHPALAIADIARRRAEQARDRMLFLIFRHIDDGHLPPAAKQNLGNGGGGLRLAHPARPDQQKHPARLVRVRHAGAGDTQLPVQDVNRLRLSADALPQVLGKTQRLAGLVAGHRAQRHPGPFRNRSGHRIRSHLKMHQRRTGL